jgi:hypothetical protein
MEIKNLLNHIGLLEDWWRRRETHLLHEKTFTAYGYTINFATNDSTLLAAANLSSQRYSQSAPLNDSRKIRLQFILDNQFEDQALPPDWPSRLKYTAVGDYLTINKDPWVNAFADLDQWTGVALVSKSLAEQPYMLSRYISDCFVLNMMLRTGWGQIHASCLYRQGKAYLIAAPHNSGKSTTAFRLVMNGYHLISDGMTYVRQVGDGVQLFGYPIGELKLRPDVVSEFADIANYGTATLVREDQKYIFNMRKLAPDRVIEQEISPQKITLCILERTNQKETTVEEIPPSSALKQIWPDTLHLEKTVHLEKNFRSINALFDLAVCYRLRIGTDVDQIVRIFDQL